MLSFKSCVPSELTAYLFHLSTMVAEEAGTLDLFLLSPMGSVAWDNTRRELGGNWMSLFHAAHILSTTSLLLCV